MSIHAQQTEKELFETINDHANTIQMESGEAELKDFLASRGITTIKKEDPEDVFLSLRNHFRWNNEEFDVETDGIIGEIYEDVQDIAWKMEGNSVVPNMWITKTSYDILNATWLIIHDRREDDNGRKDDHTLYTLAEDVTKLDIPQKYFSELHNERERFLNGEIDYPEPLPAYVANDRECCEYYYARTNYDCITVDAPHA